MAASETVGDWIALVHDRYPPAHAASWDNVGLQVGDPDWPVARVLVCLDVTGDVIDEAATVPGTLVLAHHPLLFRPLATLTPATAAGRTALHAATARVPVVAAHTNLDVARDGAGTSDPVADVLGLVDRRPLTTELRDGDRVKLVTFVPDAHVDPVLDALAAAGAGTIGDYERCAFRVSGQGTFRPRPGADPFSGRVGEVAIEDEVRLEVEVPRRRVGAVVRALSSAHPYEEVAYDLVPLIAGADVGFGVVGDLPEPTRLEDVAAAIAERLPAPHLRTAGDLDRLITTVATVGGAGDGLIGAAIGAGVDLYVTGDLRHHVTLDALEQGLALIDAGHHATEAAALPAWIERLREAATGRSLTAAVVASKVRTVPWS
ncbi:MAG: Nif3-like dinuclear metal center hexameric protein [Nitriliruptor sp.]|uniref:Nif3-like dinuclear metal center hexameric protein n=1 Tax=Nitriliruptor sp. TaxID=2448056 RepID=UPI0034A03FF8